VQHTQREFFHAVLAHSGRPCLALKKPGSKGMRHSTSDTIDAFCDRLETVEATVDDAYFCISTMVRDKVEDRGSMRTRTQANASHTRCFVLDIDIHPEKPDAFYTSQEEGREGLQRLIGVLGMPQPIVVNSGYGLHVYWPLAEGIRSHEWKEVADRFKRVLALIEPKLSGDGSRVADSAGLLRVPGTMNLKNDTAVPVVIEQWSDETMDFGVFAQQMRMHGGPTPTAQKPVSLVPTVSLDVAREEMEPVALTSLVKNCNWVARYLKGMDQADEPEWYAMLGLAPFVTHTSNGKTINGAQVAHLFSRNHSAYTPFDTERKYQQAQFAQTGPTTCARLQGIKREGCDGCPFIGDVRSPAAAARLSRPITEPKAVETTVRDGAGTVTQATVHIPVPPHPYFRGEDGGVFVRAKVQDEGGEWTSTIQKVYDYDLYPTRRYRTENVETEALEIQLHLPRDGMRTFKMPTEHLADQKKLCTYLMGHGVVPEVGGSKILTKYMIDYVRDMQMNKAAEVEFSRFGWRDITTAHPKFVVGNGYISKDARLNAGSFSPFLKRAALAVASVGDLEEWKKAFNVYKGVENSEPFQICSLLGFAAPLLALTEYRGVLFNMVGYGGAGKSTALRIMSTIWGQPNASHILKDDTEIAMQNTLGYFNCIPVAFDELTKWEPDKVGRFVLSLTGGRGKMRATRNGTTAVNDTEWDTIVACSSNTSLYNKLAEARTGYTAEAMRVYEVNVPEGNPAHKQRFAEANAILLKNYGLAGRVFMEWLIKHLPEVQHLVEQAMVRLDAVGQRRTDERFWVALLATLQISGAITRKMGLHDYNVEHLVRWASDQTIEARVEIDSTHASPLSVLADYFNETLDGTLYFREGTVNLDGPGTYVRSVKNRMESTNGVIHTAYLSVAALRAYCLPRSIDMAWLKRGLMEAGVMPAGEITKRLATGTPLPNTPTRAWTIDMTHALLNDVAVLPPEEIAP
jgi:hypothetical protein